MNSIYFLGITFFSTIIALELPSYFPRCCLNNTKINDCIVEAAMKVKPFIKNGIRELGIESLYPIVVSAFAIDHLAKDGEFIAIAHDFTFYGLDNYQIENLEFNPKEVILKGQINFNELFTYCFFTNHRKGILIDVPITGDGIFGGLLGPMNITFAISADLVKRNGVEYAQLKDVSISSDISQYGIQYEGLDYENGVFGNTNDVLRKGNKLVALALTDPFDNMFKTFLSGYLTWMLERIAYTQLFPC